MRVIHCVILYFLQCSLYAAYASELQKVDLFSTLPNEIIEREILHQALVKDQCRQMLKLGSAVVPGQCFSQKKTLNLEFPVTFNQKMCTPI